jgi:hypothetical protein
VRPMSILNFSTLTLKQGSAVFTLPFFFPACCAAHIFLTSDYVAGVPMEVSGSVLSRPDTPGPENSTIIASLVQFSSPYVIVT